MAFRNPILEAEPYEESQGDSLTSPTSPDDLKAFYSNMERQDLERKLSRNKTGSRSIWSRKSVKKSLSPEQPPREFSSTAPVKPQNEKGTEGAGGMSDDTNKKSTPIIATSRSIIPDSLGSLPSWQSKEAWAAVPLPTYKAKYPIHNPFGPRWYKNQHLIPQRPATQPLSVFSPSFPSLPPSPHERPEDQSRAPGPSRTPSGSPLPTPTSSQTGIADNGGRTRSRKTSHDTVDLLDVSDPWGTNWHHQSPYDIGLNTNTNTLDSETPRPRVATTTPGQSRHKTVSPSPLSQSTSALHLHLQTPKFDGGLRPYRKLSKRRTPVLQSLFRNHDKDSNNAAPQTVSLPTSQNRSPSPFKSDDEQRAVHPERHSALPAPSQNRKERRTSILGRLAKRFSLLKKPIQDRRTGDDDNWHHISAADVVHDGEIRQSISVPKRISVGNVMSEQDRHAENLDRVPHDVTVTKGDRPNRPAHPRSSSPVSLAPIGRLTIANPDTHEEANIGTRNRVPFSPDVKPEPKPEIPLPPKEESGHSARIPESAHSPLTLDCPASPPPTHIPSTTSPQTTLPFGVDVPWTQSPIELAKTSQVTPEAVPDEKPQAKAVPSTESGVPFPVSPDPSLPEIPSLLSPPPVAPLSITDSPLSTSSLFVNPPTPHVAEIPIPSPDVPVPPTRPSLETRRSSQDRPVRQTETFKLVRNSSGNLHPVGGTILAAGQHWEVVESDVPRRSKTKEKSSRPKDRESGSRRENGSRREHRHQEKPRAEANAAPRRTSQTRQRSDGRNTDPSTAPSSGTSGRRRAYSADLQHGRGISASALVGNEEHKPSRRRDEERRKHPDGEVRPNGINFDKPQPPPPPPTPGPSQVERRPSTSTRPTSELPSSAELNALRARDVWDMERLWKGRSMYEAEPKEMTSPDGSTKPNIGRDDSNIPVTHGSSHTSFIVQTSFQGQSPYPNIYHSMPVAPPPIVYDSTSSQTIQHHGYNHTHQPFPTSFSSLQDISSPSPSSRSTLANPLPAPPRESSYKPTPLPATLLDSSSGRSADYWAKYASVTAAH